MRIFVFTRRLSVALLLIGTAGPAAVAVSGGPVSSVVADNPAAHPAFTVRVVGQGPPMLLIPGLTCPGAVWDETVAHYRRQYRCHIVSLAGFGGAAPTAALANPLLAAVRDQLLAYIKAQKLNKPVVVGHSLGGFLALWLSTTRPGAVGPLVILDSLPFLAAIQNPATTVATATPAAAAVRQQMRQGHLPAAAARQMAAGMVTDTARIAQVMRWGAASDPATTAQAMYDLCTTDLRADLGRIRQPVLVLGTWAAYRQYGATKASTRAIFAQQYARLPQQRIELSEAGRHFVMYDDTAWFFAQTDAFLQAHPVAAN